MSLTPGTRLGPYEIVSALGAGGMGEVYRAQDTTLDREVAIKVLPAHLAEDPDALARFEREAKTLAALNHPNIAAVFGVGDAGESASRSRPRPFLVMELLEGETLRARLTGGPLPPRKVVQIGVDIAHGLAAAHARGIVHRDLKPENIFVTTDGRVKILDFGLARPLGAAGDETVSPTVRQTDPGTVLGTVGYMAPEQVKGQPADHRADIFALGCVLFELATGRRAFQRDTPAETMTAILRDDAPEMTRESGSGISSAIEPVIRHCLEKQPDERFQSARDLAFALEATSGSRSQQTVAVGPPVRRRRRWTLPAAMLVVAAASVAGTLWFTPAASPPLPAFERVTFRRGTIDAARFEPGSRNVVYSARWEGGSPASFSVHPGSPESRAVGAPNSVLLSISASQEAAVMLSPRISSGQLAGTLAVMPLGGGGARELATRIIAADFCPGGELVANEYTGDTNRIHLPVGHVIREETEGMVATIRCAPAGALIAMTIGRVLRIIDTTGAVRADVPDVATGIAWRPDGRELWYSRNDSAGQSTILAVTPGGTPRPVWRGRSLVLQDIAADGTVLAVATDVRGGVLVQRAGSPAIVDAGWLSLSEAADVSPDGGALLINEYGDAGGGFYLRRLDGSPPVRLGAGVARAWSPDGLRVLSFTGPRTSALVPVGAGATRELPHPGVWAYFGWFHPDGRILINGREPDQPYRFWWMDSSGATRPARPEGLDHWAGQKPLSHDGRFLAAFESGASMSGTVAIYPLDGGEPEPVIGMNPNEVVIRFTNDDRHLLVYDRDRLPARIFELDYRTGARRLWREFAPADPAGMSGFPTIAMSADGSVVAYNYVRALGTAYLIEGLK